MTKNSELSTESRDFFRSVFYVADPFCYPPTIFLFILWAILAKDNFLGGTLIVFLIFMWFVDKRQGEWARYRNHMKSNLDGLHCTECGAPSYTAEHKTGNNSQDGNPVYVVERHCPNEGDTGYGRADNHSYLSEL